jgi:hypothetical protein
VQHLHHPGPRGKHVPIQLANYSLLRLPPQCLWGAESAKKPHNKQYVDGLRSVNNVLEKKNKVLEEQVPQLRDALNISPPDDEFGYCMLNVADAASPASSSSLDSGDSHGFVKIEEHDDADIAAIAVPMHHLHVSHLRHTIRI